MQEENLIPADEFCNNYDVEVSFIHLLHEYGLVEITTIEERGFIHAHKLNDIEKFIHLHYDLEINMPGIEAVSHLLERVKNMQHEITMLKNRLHLHES